MLSNRFEVSISLILLFFTACGPASENQEQARDQRELPATSVEAINYAEGFRIGNYQGHRHITVFSPWKRASDTLHYLLLPKEENKKDYPAHMVTVQTPVRSVVCLSTTHLAFIDLLEADSTLKGIAGTKWVTNAEIAEMIASGRIKDVGNDSHLNYELILELDPDVVFAYGIEGHAMSYLEKLPRFGIPVVMVAEYMETDPLGKAEWIKFMGAFFGREELAERKFAEIEAQYLEVKTLAAQAEGKPTVFTGLPWKGDWFVPGGNSFQARLFKDAGAFYLWQENEERSGMIVDIEVVFERALKADFWLNVNDYHSLQELLALDERYGNFKALREQQVYNNNKRQNAAMGNDYWESGVVNPHLVLKDLVKMFHPELMEEHEFYYYHQLK